MVGSAIFILKDKAKNMERESPEELVQKHKTKYDSKNLAESTLTGHEEIKKIPHSQISEEKEKNAIAIRKHEVETILEPRKADGDNGSKKNTNDQPQSISIPENKEPMDSKIQSSVEPSPRQYLVAEIIKKVTANTNTFVIPDALTIDVVKSVGDIVTNFNYVDEVTKDKLKRKQKAELEAEPVSYVFGKPKENKIEFQNFSTNNNLVWIGLDKDYKTNSLILIIPQCVNLNIEGKNKKTLGMLIDETSLLLGNTTNIVINGYALNILSYKDKTLKSLSDILKNKVEEENKILADKLDKISKEGNIRTDLKTINVAYTNREIVSKINNYSKHWLDDANDNIRIPANQGLRKSNDPFPYDKIYNQDDSYLMRRYPEVFSVKTNKHSFSEYRDHAQELINEWRATYYLKAIDKPLDQISNAEYSKEYEVHDNDEKRAKEIDSTLQKLAEGKKSLKKAEEDQSMDINILSNEDVTPNFKFTIQSGPD